MHCIARRRSRKKAEIVDDSQSDALFDRSPWTCARLSKQSELPAPFLLRALQLYLQEHSSSLFFTFKASMNGPYRQPDKQEMRVVLYANITTLAIYFSAIRATPWVSLPPLLANTSSTFEIRGRRTSHFFCLTSFISVFPSFSISVTLPTRTMLDSFLTHHMASIASLQRVL